MARSDDIAALVQLTRTGERLVTLVGPAGVGTVPITSSVTRRTNDQSSMSSGNAAPASATRP